MHRFTRAQGEREAIELSSRATRDPDFPKAGRNFSRQPRAALTKPPYCAVIAPSVRKTTITIFILVLLWLGWSAWPFAGLYDLARAVQSGDVTKIEQRVDYPALGRSLGAQIVQTYGRLAGVPIDRGSLVAGLASAVADPLVARLLTRVALAEFLRNGWPTEVLGDRPAEFTAPNWNALGNGWQLYANSEYGIGEFRLWIPIDQPRPRQFRIQLSLRGWGWKLTGLELPQELQDRLARELMKQQGKGG